MKDINFTNIIRKILMKIIKPLDFILSLIITSPDSLKQLLRSKNSINTSEPSVVPPTEVDTVASIAFPLATYAAIKTLDNTIHVAEASAHKTTIYQRAFEHEITPIELSDMLDQIARERNLQFVATALQEEDSLKQMLSYLWLHEDIVPYVIGEQDPERAQTLEEQAQRIAANFDENNIVRTHLSKNNEVQVSELVTLADYQQMASPEDFARLIQLARMFAGKRLVFLSSTPQGGGVALMRHALIRLLRLLRVDAHWHVLIPKKAAFDITKTKFHNVLQGVASKEITLTPDDELFYGKWMQENAVFLDDVFKQADVIVIDDPQPSGLIPHIKRANPVIKIIYRSHIQIMGHQVNQPGTPQYTTWKFLWNAIEQADYFVSHPIKIFVPDNVPAEKVFYMPATTDPLDGLNKPLTQGQMSTYMQLFNTLLLQDQQTPLDTVRPYLIQVARFDPSKGISDVLEAYKKLRAMLEAHNKPAPQLVIAGNSSIDDPDGMRVYDQVRSQLSTESYRHFAYDVKVTRLPHRDQILNTLLRKSQIVLQLSIREGFEVKVTEALMKGKPVVGCNVGGIPLQIQPGVTGYLVEAGDTTQVAQHLYELLTNESLYQNMSSAALIHTTGSDYLTVSNAICWLYLALQLLSDERPQGQYQWVKTLAMRSLKKDDDKEMVNLSL